MSTGQLKICFRALCTMAIVACSACAVDTSEPYPDDIEQEEPTVVTGQSLNPSSMERPEGGGTDEGPGSKQETEETTTGASTEDEEKERDREPDPDPWKIPIPDDPGGGDDEGSSGEDPP